MKKIRRWRIELFRFEVDGSAKGDGELTTFMVTTNLQQATYQCAMLQI